MSITAKPLSLPAPICAAARLALTIMNCTRPPIRSSRAGGAPRYATCVALKPASRMNASVPRCAELPAPGVAYEMPPGACLA
ncbi:Uncharacterised protein [Bordetella pertussis]|nr:Uncharacterised protein [Bordetella pertussis]CPN87951.1 Uncharacterised protein [Bordetella pertussis]